MNWHRRRHNSNRVAKQLTPDLRFAGTLTYGSTREGDNFYVAGIRFADGRKHVVRSFEQAVLIEHLQHVLNRDAGKPISADVMIWLPKRESWKARVRLDGTVSEVFWRD